MTTARFAALLREPKFDDSVKRAVLKAGFFVIEQTGNTVKINVPEDFKPKEW